MAGSDDGFEGGSRRSRGSSNSDGVGSGQLGDDSAIDPATLAGSGSGGDVGSGGADEFERDANGNVVIGTNGKPKRKRGRRAGSNPAGKSAPRSNDLKASVDGLANMLAVLHTGIALATRAPEMELDDTEAKMLAAATVPVLEQFNFTPDPRYAAAFALLMACGKIYVPRAFLIKSRLEDEAKTRQRPAPRPSAPMPTPTAPGGIADFGAPIVVN